MLHCVFRFFFCISVFAVVRLIISFCLGCVFSLHFCLLLVLMFLYGILVVVVVIISACNDAFICYILSFSVVFFPADAECLVFV